MKMKNIDQIVHLSSSCEIYDHLLAHVDLTYICFSLAVKDHTMCELQKSV